MRPHLRRVRLVLFGHRRRQSGGPGRSIRRRLPAGAGRHLARHPEGARAPAGTSMTSTDAVIGCLLVMGAGYLGAALLAVLRAGRRSGVVLVTCGSVAGSAAAILALLSN